MTTTAHTHFTVALIGNPNTGKSTLFTGLVGIHQHVGNYPGVTVEKKTGRMEFAGRRFELIDLPGLYSLAPRSRDEMVAVDLLLGRRKDLPPVDAVLCIVDAGNLERNLYLVSQVLELGLPTVLAVNMLDVAEDHGIAHRPRRGSSGNWASRWSPIQANRRIGLARVEGGAGGADRERTGASRRRAFPATSFCSATRTRCPRRSRRRSRCWSRDWRDRADRLPRCLVRRLLLDVSGYLQRTLLDDGDGRWRQSHRGRAGPAGRRQAAPCRPSRPPPATTGPAACLKA